jgi:hypothetical protein
MATLETVALRLRDIIEDAMATGVNLDVPIKVNGKEVHIIATTDSSYELLTDVK